ncbi:MAG: glycine/betaine ABC transporter permease, partial [Gemmobacter sp.]
MPEAQARLARALLAAAVVLTLARFALPAGLVRPPEWMILPFADWINAAFAYAQNELGLMTLTRAFAGGVEWCLDVTANLLYGKSRWPRIGPLPWTVVAVTAGVVGYALGGIRLAALSGGTFVWIAVMGQWKWAMETLSVIVVAAPVSVALGIATGTLAWRSRRVEKVLNPIL